MHITNEQLENYEQQVQVNYSRHTKAVTIAQISAIVSSIVFLVFSLIVTYCGILHFDRLYPVEEQALVALEPFNRYCVPIMQLLQIGVQPWYIVLAICLCAIVLFPFALNIVLKLFLSVCLQGNKLQGLPSEPASRLNSLIVCAQTSDSQIPNTLENSRRLINWLYVIGLAAIVIYGAIVSNVPVNGLFHTAIGFVLILAVIFWIYRVLLLAFGSLSGLLWRRYRIRSAELIQKMKGDLTTEKRLHNEEVKREKEEKEKKIAAQKKKEAEKKRKEADEVYAQATATEKYDEALIEKAANMGSPDACLYHGRKLIGKWSSEPLTRTEKTNLIKLAAGFLATAAPYSTEADFLWIFARTQYEKNSKDKWEAMLKRVREIKPSGELREEYEETCDLLLNALVGIIDATPNKSAPPKPSSYSTSVSTRRSPYSSPMTSAEKMKYINEKCLGMWSSSGITTIENDPDLTPSQKEDLLMALKIYGD